MLLFSRKIEIPSPKWRKGEVSGMPITDVAKKQLAQKRKLFFKICLRCGKKNAITATRCRRCRSDDLRLKNRTLGAKK
jgi:large subunit ribosomal protein L40e